MEAIARAEDAIRAAPTRQSLYSTLRSLEKQRVELEEHFEHVASAAEVDICRYRLLPDGATRYSLTGVAESWGSFQRLFSVVYSALKSGTNAPTRVSSEIAQDTAFGVAYSFQGSLGVALTIPRERLVFEETMLDSASETVFALAKAQSKDEIGAFVERIGLAPIRSVYTWADRHASNGFGVGVEWKRDSTVRRSLIAQRPELERLRSTLDKSDLERTEEFEVSGILQAAHVTRKTFQIDPDQGPPISGRFEDAIDTSHTVTLPKRYRAIIRRTTRNRYADEDVIERYFLVKLL